MYFPSQKLFNYSKKGAAPGSGPSSNSSTNNFMNNWGNNPEDMTSNFMSNTYNNESPQDNTQCISQNLYNPNAMQVQNEHAEANLFMEDYDIDCQPEYSQLAQTFVPWSDSMFKFKKMDHVRLNRARLIDWLVEICYIFNQSWQTLWAAIGILDRMIVETGKVKLSNIHLFGCTVIFMASKYHETQPISLKQLIKNVCHRRYTKQEILACQAQIFTWICLVRNDTSLHFATFEDRISEEFPGLDLEIMRRIMTELFYCIQDPNLIFNEMVDITEKELVRQVGQSILKMERYQNCEGIEAFYRDEYECENIRKFGPLLKF